MWQTHWDLQSDFILYIQKRLLSGVYHSLAVFILLNCKMNELQIQDNYRIVWNAQYPINRGSYTSGHFIWNLLNEPVASFINFIWNDHECKILFIIWPFKMGFNHLQNDHYFNKKHMVDTVFVSDLTSMGQSVITHVVIRFLWHDVIHWITVTSYDKSWGLGVNSFL